MEGVGTRCEVVWCEYCGSTEDVDEGNLYCKCVTCRTVKVWMCGHCRKQFGNIKKAE